jgi:phosphoadenosine phosphosulfate reductase
MFAPAWTPERLAELSEELEGKDAARILHWAVDTFFPRLTMATAFGPEGCILIHLLADIEPRVHFFNLETGYQFPETLALRNRLQERYGVQIELVRPDTTVEEYERLHGSPLYRTLPDQCCHDRKIVPLRRTLEGKEAWISAIRAEQSVHRQAARTVMWDAKFNLVKINPLLRWTRREVWDFIVKYDVPYNPLHDQGYPSIGCWPCTRAVNDGADERAGRWAGTAKKECGLHTLPMVNAPTSV